MAFPAILASLGKEMLMAALLKEGRGSKIKESLDQLATRTDVTGGAEQAEEFSFAKIKDAFLQRAALNVADRVTGPKGEPEPVLSQVGLGLTGEGAVTARDVEQFRSPIPGGGGPQLYSDPIIRAMLGR